MRKLLTILFMVPIIVAGQTMRIIRGGNHPDNKKISIGAPIVDSIFYTGLIHGLNTKIFVGIVKSNATDSQLYDAIKSQMHPMKRGYYLKGKDEVFIIHAE